MTLSKLEVIVQTMRKMANEMSVTDPKVEFFISGSIKADKRIELDVDVVADVERSVFVADSITDQRGDFVIALRNIQRFWSFSCVQKDGSVYQFEGRFDREEAENRMRGASKFYTGCTNWQLVKIEE